MAHAFPITAGRVDYGRSHHDYPATDMFAACGSDIVSPVAGTVNELGRTDLYDPAVNDPATRGGLFLSIVGDDGVRYYMSHMASVDTDLAPGMKVDAARHVGTVGDTGNAAGTGCHVHFGISPPCPQSEWSVRRGAVYPWPYLDEWRAGHNATPRVEVDAWVAATPGGCAEAAGTSGG